MNPGALPGRPPARFPRLSQSDFTLGRPEARPRLSRRIDDGWFGEPHKRVLRQLLSAIKAQVRQRERSLAAYNEDAASATVLLFDVGAGTGAATAFLCDAMEAGPAPMAYGACARVAVVGVGRGDAKRRAGCGAGSGAG